MTLTDKEILEIERILDDLETYVQSHIKERRVILAEILKIRRILKSGEQQIFYKDSWYVLKIHSIISLIKANPNTLL